MCITYPFDDEKANLNMIKILRNKFNCNVGYSGHEKGGMAISIAAIALGATSLERHITLDRTMYGLINRFFDSDGFINLTKAVRKVEKQ